mmetsp:Transcript_80030/g.138912  ORF Transcript_80030/g.138912 Transcript_80030/m.138912 type:complete len:324 (+) Transcript_80030:83-1054(+)
MERKAEVQGSLIYCNAANYHFAPETVQAEELVVWGGMVANCAEDALSRVVDSSSQTLRSVTYCPDRTKGGVLIRPKYYQGDRSGRAVFSRLTDLAIRLEPALLPIEFGWTTPELQRLRLLCVISASDRSRDERGAGRGDFRLPHCGVLREWLGVEDNNCADAVLMVGRRGAVGHLRDMILDSCPKLESITIAVCSTACLADQKEADRSETDWIVLLPPKPLPWSVHRLLLLPVVKPVVMLSKIAAADASPESRATYRSPLSTLTVNLIKHIITFLGRPHWEHQDRHIPASVAKRLGLPESFRTTRCSDLMKESPPKWEWDSPN